MSESTNGVSAQVEEDVQMKDEDGLELNNAPTISDLTDPNPPPQLQSNNDPETLGVSSTEHLSTIVPPIPGTTPPPAGAGAPTTLAAAAATTPARTGSQTPLSSATAQQTSVAAAAQRPDKPVAHGGPTRQYLNANVTPHLLEAMKQLATQQPEKPLRWLADFLGQRSGEVEGL